MKNLTKNEVYNVSGGGRYCEMFCDFYKKVKVGEKGKETEQEVLLGKLCYRDMDLAINSMKLALAHNGHELDLGKNKDKVKIFVQCTQTYTTEEL